MPKLYYPSLSDDVQDMAQFLSRYDSAILAALAVTSPENVATYVALRDAVFAFNAIRNILVPLLGDA